MTQRIAVIPGDGIGPEVARIGVRVLESLGLPLQFEWFDFGADRYLRDGTTLPAGFMDTLRRDYAAIYFGAVEIGRASCRERVVVPRVRCYLTKTPDANPVTNNIV